MTDRPDGQHEPQPADPLPLQPIAERHHPTRPPTHGLALAAILLGLAMLCGSICGPIASRRLRPAVIGWFICSLVVLTAAIAWRVWLARRSTHAPLRWWAVAVNRLIIGLCIIFTLVGLSMPYQRIMGQVQEGHNRMNCGDHMRNIGRALIQFAQTHHGEYPASFEELLKAGDITPAEFVCWSSNDTAAQGANLNEILAEFRKPGHCSYVYVGAGLTTKSSPDAIVAYERIENHEGIGMNVLYNNGAAEWLQASYAEHILRELKAGRNPPQSQPLPTTRGN